MIRVYPIVPIAAPRMTRADRWKQRPVVLRYFAYKEECKKAEIVIYDRNVHIIFHIPMSASWSAKKKREHVGQPHKFRPDVDNLLKGLLDAVFDEDSQIWDVRVTKLWAYEGSIEIRQ